VYSIKIIISMEVPLQLFFLKMNENNPLNYNNNYNTIIITVIKHYANFFLFKNCIILLRLFFFIMI